MTANILARETSPYLLQHKDNPVHWQPWGAEALAAAKESDRPILLSVGYAACHWCHVMAHESFEDPETAAVMNDLFVNIKVDREERPDLDSIYQTALAIMGEQGGWPLTIFLTPEGEPFFGGTYFPPTARYGRPGFTDVLNSISNAYHRDKDKVKTNVTAIRQALDRISKPEGQGTLSLAVLDRAAASALGAVDPLHGGTHGAPKFPQPSFFKFLWHAHKRTRSPMFREAVTLTLDNLCQGGIYDHAGGGFARYATDEVWLVPHFEKMLYDNALLIELLTYAWIETGSPLYAARVAETVAWALRDMVSAPAGRANAFAFVSAYDADSEGEEGKYYVWSAAEIDTLLGADASRFKTIYDVTPEGNWEGHTILNRRVPDGLADAATEAMLARARANLLAVRAKRVPPLRDDKVLTDWNGLMIAALARAGSVFGRPEWVEAAKTAYAFVRENASADGRLRHTWCAGQARHPAVLDDYANMSRAALVLAEVTGSPDAIADAKAWVEAANAYHWDDAGKGYFLSASDTPNLITRSKSAQDNAVPSGNGTMLEVLARLHHLTGDAAYRERAEDLVRLFSTAEPQQLIHRPVLLMGFEMLERATRVVVVGAKTHGETKALADAALRAAPPTLVLTQIAPGAALPAGHPAAGKDAIGGQPTAYVCVGQTCGLPIQDGAALEAALRAI
ncbi:MAG: thioredoxin domain-containing protein [Rhodospirillales bacterium]|nr:thioredoxin domain-containing protein [Rhodospirillales bacterium]